MSDPQENECDWYTVLSIGIWMGLALAMLIMAVLALNGHQKALQVIVGVGQIIALLVGIEIDSVYALALGFFLCTSIPGALIIIEIREVAELCGYC